MMFSLARKILVMTVLAALGPLCAHAAAASGPPVAAVVRGSGAGSDKAAALVAHYLRAELSHDERFSLAPNALQGTGEQEPAMRALVEAGELVRKAMGAYETLELDQAVESLGQALQRYERNAAFVTDIKEVASALMLLGAVHILRGDKEAGTDRIAQALAISPGLEADSRIFGNPSMRQAYRRTSEQSGRRPKGSLSVSSNPSYAELYVDGEFRGITPATVAQLNEGRHYVRLVKDGYRPWGGIVTIPARGEANESGVLRPLANSDEYEKATTSLLADMRAKSDGSDRSLDESASVLQRMLSVDNLVAVEIKLDGEQVKLLAALYELTLKRRAKVATHAFPFDARPEAIEREVAAFWRKHFNAAALAQEDSATPGGDDSGGTSGSCAFKMECGRFKKLALTAGIGGGALLGGLGTVLYILAYNDNQSFKTAKQVGGNADSLRSSGKLKGLIGDIMVPLGIGAIGAGLWAYFFYNPEGFEPAPAASKVGVTLELVPGGGALSTAVRF